MTVLVIEVSVPTDNCLQEDADAFTDMIRHDLNKHGWGVQLRDVEYAGDTYDHIKKGWLNNGDR